MYHIPYAYYQYPYYRHWPMYNYYGNNHSLYDHSNSWDANTRVIKENGEIVLTDHGPNPYVVNINEATKQNNTFRTALWTGEHLQVTLMSLNVGEDIGLEAHPNVDQFLRIEQGQGLVQMGKTKDHLNFKRYVNDDFAIMVPAGTWHNLTNIGSVPLKLYSIYAPPNHPFGTVHPTKADAMAEEKES